MAEHRLERGRVHHEWDNSLDPVLTIRSGDTVHLDLLMAGSGQVERDSTYADARFDFKRHGSFAPFPPHEGGGNVDTRHLREGSRLWLPVWCPGALFSCGDPHGVQGDGEVCVTGLECNMRATLRLHVHKQRISAPRFFAPSPLLPQLDGGGHLGTMGIAPDLMDGAKAAVREMIALLVERHPLSREDAYLLCSLAGDLKILEVVDAGMWNVGFTVPLDVFREAA